MVGRRHKAKAKGNSEGQFKAGSTIHVACLQEVVARFHGARFPGTPTPSVRPLLPLPPLICPHFPRPQEWVATAMQDKAEVLQHISQLMCLVKGTKFEDTSAVKEILLPKPHMFVQGRFNTSIVPSPPTVQLHTLLACRI
jgi:hypothetical protein